MKGLILLAHGSKAGEYAKVIEEHKNRLEKFGIFDEVKIAYLESEPSLAEIVKSCKSTIIYIVPLFISYGMHTLEQIPRIVNEIKSKNENKKILLCEPIGTDPLITYAILNKVFNKL